MRGPTVRDRPDHSRMGSALDQQQHRISDLSDAALSRRQRRDFPRRPRAHRAAREAAVKRRLYAALALAGYRQMIVRDTGGKIERHFVILPFAARWISGEISLNEELAEASWLLPSELSGLKTTEGLAEIVAAGARLAAQR